MKKKRSAKKKVTKKISKKKPAKKKTVAKKAPAKKKTAKKKVAKKAAPKKKAAKKKTAKKAPAKKTTSRKKATISKGKSADASSMAKRQREISVSEFFTKNRHLLGFDNPSKALLTTIKEAVDNSLDACEEANILPDLVVKIEPVEGKDRFLVIVRDNGPGIVKTQVPKIFAKLLYGSKFHSMKQSRGQQGIGISAAGMYGQLTTGKPVTIISRTSKRKPAIYVETGINTTKNTPDIYKEKEMKKWDQDRGTEVRIELVGKHKRGRTSVDEYLRQTAVANPHLNLHYTAPDGTEYEYERSTKTKPQEAKEIKPHPYGVELGMLLKMAQSTSAKKIAAFLQNDFSRISANGAKQICKKAGISPQGWCKSITHADAEKIYDAIQETPIMAPPTDCVVPIGEDLIIKSLKAQFDADLYFSITRKPTVYRGNPFVVEVGCAYGGTLQTDEDDEGGHSPAQVLRLANRVPLQHQPAACCITRSVIGTNWKNYGMSQPRGALPLAPMIILVHIASVWVPFTNEAKEAVANYPEIENQITRALQDVGRKLSTHIRKVKREAEEERKRSYITKYIPHIAIGLQEILEFSDKEKTAVENKLTKMLEKSHLQLKK